MAGAQQHKAASAVPHVDDLDALSEAVEATTAEHMETDAQKTSTRRAIGQVVSVTGDRVLVMLNSENLQSREHMPRLGGMVCIETGLSDLVGTVAGLSAPAPEGEIDGRQVMLAELELLGAFFTLEDGRKVIRRGVTIFPALGDVAAAMTRDDLTALYGADDTTMMGVGTVTNAAEVPAMLNPDHMLDSNFVMLGMTGAGKSCGAALLVRALVRYRHPVRTIIIDTHNEYTRSFGRAAHVIDPREGVIAYWMLSFNELVYLYDKHGGKMSKQETELLADAVTAARRRYLMTKPEIAGARSNVAGVTVPVDTPLPYRLTDMISFIDAHIQADDSSDREAWRRLRVRIDMISRDPDYRPVFGLRAARDTLDLALAQLFRIPHEGKPITLFQTDGLALPVAEVMVSMIARFAKLVVSANKNQTPLLLLMEDAHRFVPADKEKAPVSSDAIGQILEKSTKLAVSLGLITSQPRSLSRAVLEQCKTLFAMRMTSKANQAFVNEITPESASGLLSGIGVLGRSEAIAIGGSVRLPMRMQFGTLPKEAVPGGPVRRSDRARPENQEDSTVGTIVDALRFPAEGSG